MTFQVASVPKKFRYIWIAVINIFLGAAHSLRKGYSLFVSFILNRLSEGVKVIQNHAPILAAM